MFSRIAETMIAAPKLLKYCKYIQKQKRLCSCLQTSQLDVACFAPRSSPGIYPRKRDKATRSATLSTPQTPASPFVLAITRNASANDRLQPLPHARQYALCKSLPWNKNSISALTLQFPRTLTCSCNFIRSIPNCPNASAHAGHRSKPQPFSLLAPGGAGRPNLLYC